eukprot:scpid92546/ scgid1717/ 
MATRVGLPLAVLLLCLLQLTVARPSHKHGQHHGQRHGQHHGQHHGHAHRSTGNGVAAPAAAVHKQVVVQQFRRVTVDTYDKHPTTEAAGKKTLADDVLEGLDVPTHVLTKESSRGNGGGALQAHPLTDSKTSATDDADSSDGMSIKSANHDLFAANSAPSTSSDSASDEPLDHVADIYPHGDRQGPNVATTSDAPPMLVRAGNKAAGEPEDMVGEIFPHGDQHSAKHAHTPTTKHGDQQPAAAKQTHTHKSQAAPSSD